VHIVTTDEVLVEYLAAMAASGSYLRRKAVLVDRDILTDANVTVVPQTRLSLLAGIDLYEKRPDKEYSLTDCISMNVMRAEGVTEILTNDHHFEQEGFNVLVRR
jgi:predicted nucleic acid-binding protein